MPNLRRQQAAHVAYLKRKKKRQEKREKYPNRINYSPAIPALNDDIRQLAAQLGIRLD